MIRLARPVVILAMLFSPVAIMARTVVCCPSAASVATSVSVERVFVVAAVLTRHGKNIEVQLVQGYRAGQSGDEALGKFTRDALNLYPGYGILTTVVSELKTDRTAHVCGVDA